MGSFETSDRESAQHLKPLRLPMQQDSMYSAAKEMVESLAGWEIVGADDAKRVISCRKRGGLLAGESTITIRVEGPEGIPSSTVYVRSETKGGLLSPDRSNVQEFMKPFWRRVC
jgi:hypothetical protein